MKQKKKFVCLLCVVNSLTFFFFEKCVLCLHKNHLKSKHERHYFNCLTLSPSLRLWHVLFVRLSLSQCVCVRARMRPCPRVICDFVLSHLYTILITSRMRCVLFIYVFIYFSRIEKHIESDTNRRGKHLTKWKARTEHE